VSFLFAIQGFYVQRIYNQVKDKPLAIIEHSIQQGSDGSAVALNSQPIEVLWTGNHDRPGHDRP
jgi:hypothetical protein